MFTQIWGEKDLQMAPPEKRDSMRKAQEENLAKLAQRRDAIISASNNDVFRAEIGDALTRLYLKYLTNEEVPYLIEALDRASIPDILATISEKKYSPTLETILSL